MNFIRYLLDIPCIRILWIYLIDAYYLYTFFSLRGEFAVSTGWTLKIWQLRNPFRIGFFFGHFFNVLIDSYCAIWDRDKYKKLKTMKIGSAVLELSVFEQTRVCFICIIRSLKKIFCDYQISLSVKWKNEKKGNLWKRIWTMT